MTNNHLSVQAIATACGCPYTLVRRYAEAAGMAELMGGIPVKGALGLRYPPASLPRWRGIMEPHQARAITPTTAAQALPIIWGTEAGAEPLEGAQATDTPGDPWAALEGTLERIAEALERLADAVERALEEETKGTKWRRPRSRR